MKQRIGCTGMGDLIRVTMNLTRRDDENAQELHKLLDTRSKAQAISFALSLARFIVELIRSAPGTQLLVRSPDGVQQRVVMPELEQIHKATGVVG